MSTPLPGTGLALSPASAFVTGAIVPIDGRVFGFQRCLEVLSAIPKNGDAPMRLPMNYFSLGCVSRPSSQAGNKW
jgi:hypothetical protein